MLEDIVFELVSAERQCAGSDITMESHLSDLGIDSLRAITILYELEDRFEIEIPNEIIGTITTVGDIVRNIDQLLQNDRSENSGNVASTGISQAASTDHNTRDLA